MGVHRAGPANRRARVLFATVVASLTVSTVLVVPARAAALGCGDVITQDTTLTADVGPCAGTGLIVAANGVTLDLGGHSVMGDAEARSANDELGPTGRDRAGIVLRQVENVTVTNGTVTGFDAGVAIVGGGDNIVRRITARDNVNYRLITGRDARPTDVDPMDGPFCWFGEGIVTLNSPRNLVEHNLLVGNGPFSGVSLVGDSDDNVEEPRLGQRPPQRQSQRRCDHLWRHRPDAAAADDGRPTRPRRRHPHRRFGR